MDSQSGEEGCGVVFGDMSRGVVLACGSDGYEAGVRQ